MRVDTLQLVHDGANHLHAVAHLDACCLFDGHAQCVAALHGTQIVHAVGQGKRLRIGIALVEFFDASVDVAQLRVHLLDAFALEGYAEVEHAVCGGVLRAYVHHVVIGGKDDVLGLGDAAVGIAVVFHGGVAEHLVLHVQGVLLLGLVVLAHGISHPVFTQEHAAHVLMAEEAYAVEVEHFALVDVGDGPKVGHGGYEGGVAVGTYGLDVFAASGLGAPQVVDASEAFLAPVHTGDELEEVHLFLVAHAFHLVVQR